MIVPPYTVRFFEAGEHCDDASPGDWLLVNHGTFASLAIKEGQDLLVATQPELEGFTWCTHTGMLHSGGPDAIISEMGFAGYERRGLIDYKARLYAIVHFAVSDEARATAVAFDDAMKGAKYGWTEYVPFMIDGITGGQFSGSWGDSVICSVHVVLASLGFGFFPAELPTRAVPARMAFWVQAKHA